MIQQSSFLGISLRTRQRRRMLVAGYYVFLLAFVAIPLYRHKFMPGAMLAQTFVLGSFFGGFRAGLPVKPYSDKVPSAAENAEPISLNLSGKRRPFASELLDEREMGERDRAHYNAYRILLLTLGVAMAGYWIGMVNGWELLAQSSPTLFWLLFVYAVSLPQSVILWTEPDAGPEGELFLA